MFARFRYRNSDDKALAAFIQSHFGFWPKNTSIYHQAFLHKSHLREEPNAHERSNERLEFLGDAVLDTVVAEYLFLKFPSETEGFLTKLKSKIVKREMLNHLGEKFHLDQQVRHTQFGINNPKSLLGNAFEALIGAIYLDKGFEFTRKIILHRILEAHINLEELIKVESDYKSRIIIWSQRERKKIDFILISEANLGAEMQYEIAIQIDSEAIATAIARTKKEAEQLAAREAWKLMFPEE